MLHPTTPISYGVGGSHCVHKLRKRLVSQIARSLKLILLPEKLLFTWYNNINLLYLFVDNALNMPHFQPLTALGDRLSSVQSILAMKGWEGYPQFDSDKGYGRVAMLACVLSTILGINFILCLQLVLIRLGILSADIFGSYWTDDTLQMALQWTVYVQVLCIFHLGEFFTTAICNPSVTSADSFMVRMRLFGLQKQT